MNKFMKNRKQKWKQTHHYRAKVKRYYSGLPLIATMVAQSAMRLSQINSTVNTDLDVSRLAFKMSKASAIATEIVNTQIQLTRTLQRISL